MLGTGQDEHLRACSQCGTLKPPHRATLLLDDAKLPDTSDLQLTVAREQLLNW